MPSGRTWVASVPAENASNRSPASARSSPSAIWLRAELWVHRNRTRRLRSALTISLPSGLRFVCRMRDDELGRHLGDTWPEEAHDGTGDQRAQRLGNDERDDRRGVIPAKVSDRVRASVTAGLAKLVEEVKK